MSDGVSPRRVEVFSEQLASVALSVRREIGWGVLVMSLLTLLVITYRTVAQQGDGSSYPADWEIVRRDRLTMLSSVAMLLGLFAPMGFWRDMTPSRRSYFWSLPVERSAHSRVRAVAGWIVLMGALTIFVVWSGGPGDVISRDGEWWFWLVPIAAGSGAYILGTATTLLSERPWVWYAGAAIVFLTLTGMLAATYDPVLKAMFTNFFGGTYGAFHFASGYAPALVDSVEGVTPFRSDWRLWVATVAIWTTPVLVAAWAANRRYLER